MTGVSEHAIQGSEKNEMSELYYDRGSDVGPAWLLLWPLQTAQIFRVNEVLLPRVINSNVFRLAEGPHVDISLPAEASKGPNCEKPKSLQQLLTC